jgi:hypothetical protein
MGRVLALGPGEASATTIAFSRILTQEQGFPFYWPSHQRIYPRVLGTPPFRIRSNDEKTCRPRRSSAQTKKPSLA